MTRPNGSLQAGSPAATVVARRIVDLIEKRYAERLTVHSIAAGVRGKPACVGRFFHLATGRTVHEYLTEVRLDHAAHLIRSDIKIEAVALDVGYQSKKNFYRQFARRFGEAGPAPVIFVYDPATNQWTTVGTLPGGATGLPSPGFPSASRSG